MFESKYVKQIIETFSNVLELVEQQEKELDEFMGADSDEEPELSNISKVEKKSKITSTK